MEGKSNPCEEGGLLRIWFPKALEEPVCRCSRALSIINDSVSWKTSYGRCWFGSNNQDSTHNHPDVHLWKILYCTNSLFILKCPPVCIPVQHKDVSHHLWTSGQSCTSSASTDSSFYYQWTSQLVESQIYNICDSLMMEFSFEKQFQTRLRVFIRLFLWALIHAWQLYSVIEMSLNKEK